MTESDQAAASDADAPEADAPERPVGSDIEALGVAGPDDQAQGVLDFWFGDLVPSQWFARDERVDSAIRERFALTVGRVATGVEAHWAETPGGVLAAVIALDQFPRNLYRGDPRAFATDEQALALAEGALKRRFDADMTAPARQFLYMPFMHAEDPEMQERSLALFRDLGLPEATRAAERHKEIIDRFGRFPHRNAVLGRTTTPEEAAFLEEPNSSF